MQVQKNILKSTGCYGNLLEQNNFFHCISYPCLLMSHFLTEKCEQQQQQCPKNVPQVRDVVKLYVFCVLGISIRKRNSTVISL